MPESVVRIQRLLSSSARRVAWLSVGRACALALAALLAGWAALTVATAEGARGLAMAVGAAGLLGAALLAARRLWGLRATMSPAQQAAAVEAARPELRGGLATVVDRVARPMGSPGLLARLADDVARRVATVRPAEVWPGRPLWRDLRWSLLAGAAFAAVALLGPLGPVEALRLLAGGRPAAAAAAPVAAEDPHALLGDITIRYTYPAYTRLESVEVPNTNGEVRAPLGTRVDIRARTAVPWTAATLEVSGQAPAPAELVDGRQVSGSFVVDGEGTWRFDFGAAQTAAFRVVPDPDLAPTVVVANVPTGAIPVDLPFELDLAVKDDYGIVRVLAEVTVQGRVKEVELRAPLDAPRTLNHRPALRAEDLGLVAGDVAKVRVGAWDNDEVSGSKPGWSTPFTLEIVGQAGRSAANRALREALLQALVPVLADSLMDPVPPATDGAAAQAWSERVDERYAAFDEASRAIGSLDRRSFAARLVANVNGARRDLLAFVRVLPAGELGNVDLATFGELQAANVRALEMAVWSLDRIAREEAYQAIVALAEDFAEDARELRGALDALTAAQATARLDRLVRQSAELEKLTARLGRGSMREFLESRTVELQGAMAAARRDLQGDDRAAVEGDLARVAELLEEMAGGVDEAQKRGGQGDDALQKAIEQLRADLSKLEADQDALEARTKAAREAHGQSLDEGLKAWKEVDAAARDAQAALDAPGLDELGQRAAQSGVQDARHDADGLGDSVRARDTRTALDRSEDTLQSIERAQRRIDAAARTGQMDPGRASAAQEALRRAHAAATRAQRTLDELASRQRVGSPELSKALQELAGEQGQLTERAERARADAADVARAMQADASELEEASREAARQAGRAVQSMEEGDAMGAEGAQGAAGDELRRAQEALEQAVRDQQAMQRESQGGGGEEQSDEDAQAGAGGTLESQDGKLDVTIPAPEEFQTPEAYRKALLEGMQGELPEAYRAASRRYYEELVRQ